jgi:hypothetical protein
MPHVPNPAIKEAFGVAMRALGINNLPETPPHMNGHLYAAFQKVLATFGIGADAPAPTPAAPASII